MVRLLALLALCVASSLAAPLQHDSAVVEQSWQGRRRQVSANEGDSPPQSPTMTDPPASSSFCVDLVPVRGCINPNGGGSGNLPAAASAMAKATDAAAAAGPVAGWLEVGIFSSAATSLSDLVGSLAGGVWGAMQGTGVWLDGLIHGPPPRGAGEGETVLLVDETADGASGRDVAGAGGELIVKEQSPPAPRAT